jgi:hypothetical protein
MRGLAVDPGRAGPRGSSRRPAAALAALHRLDEAEVTAAVSSRTARRWRGVRPDFAEAKQIVRRPAVG